ncbi:hypothetical protein TNIN_462381 [Trichonephila inaurata madagascariensis]|uniref:Methyltransferase domain-containing protein n=1 Tax=Trichonephila inaurata madagascariensis TaxID=2747483 RepID=A0A8X7BNE1_9ARAC|nr:hypothetical protein TNIN_462381 [Trichonephila inaurata madagascariensis]
MAQSSFSLQTTVLPNCSTQFVKWCTEEFQWKDLSEDVIMDIGCGVEMNCCKAILTQFPDVRTLVAVDRESTVFQQAHFRDRRINSCVGNILERDSLKMYEGKMNKIISADTFHHIYDKEMAFRNAYRLLKPGGEAGFLFVVNSWMYKFLKAGALPENLYPPDNENQYYKEMLERIGFKDVRAFEEEKRFCFPTDECFKDSIVELYKVKLKIPPEAAETFEKELIELYEREVGRYEGKLCYVSVRLNLLGVKPLERSDSKSKETTVD